MSFKNLRATSFVAIGQAWQPAGQLPPALFTTAGREATTKS
jgi:hypothetical protein